MTQPALAQATDHGRMYARTVGGELVHPSITTIIGCEPAPELLNWYGKKAAQEAFSRFPVMQAVMQETVAERYERRRRDGIRYLASAGEREANEASARGDLVHNYGEAIALRQLGEVEESFVSEMRQRCLDARLSRYVASMDAFWNDWQPEVVQPEATVWNDTVGYAGTTDLLFKIKGHLIVGDYKTRDRVTYRREPSKFDLKPHTGMQLAAAARAEQVWRADTAESTTAVSGTWKPVSWHVETGIGVAIAPDGYAVREYDIWADELWESFCALRHVWDWMRQRDAVMSERVTLSEGLSIFDTTRM